MAKKVSEAMTPGVQSVTLTQSLADAAEIMNQNDVGSLPVVDDDRRLVGILADRDIVLRAVAERVDPQSVKVGDVAAGSRDRRARAGSGRGAAPDGAAPGPPAPRGRAGPARRHARSGRRRDRRRRRSARRSSRSRSRPRPSGSSGMATCEVCGNEYDKSFEVRRAGETHVFDSFECAIHMLAPICEHCGLPRDRARRRGERGDLLLRPLRLGRRCRRARRPREAVSARETNAERALLIELADRQQAERLVHFLDQRACAAHRERESSVFNATASL